MSSQLSSNIYALNLFIEHSGNTDENRIFFVYHITSSLAKLSTWCFEHSGDISCSLIVNPSHTDWVLERTKHVFVDIYSLNLFTELSVEHWWEQNIFCSFKIPQAFCKAQHLMLRGLWWHQLFSNRWRKRHWWILGRMKHVSVDIYIYIYIFMLILH